MYRDANFQHAEIVRSKRHRAAPSGVQEQCHFREPGEICHCISDITDHIDIQKICQNIIK